MVKFRVLEYSQDFLTKMGIHSHNLNEPTNELFNSLATYFHIFFSYGVFGISSAVVAYKNWPVLEEMLEPISLAVAGYQSGGMFLSIGLKMKKVKALHLELQKIVNEGDETSDIYWEAEQKSRKYARTITSYVFVNQSMHVGAFLGSLYNLFIRNYDTTTWIVAFHLWVPFDATNLWGWYITWFLAFNASLSYSSCTSSITAYFVACCIYINAICDYFDFAYNSLMDAVQLNRKEINPVKYQERRRQINEKICKVVAIHVKISEVFKMVADINSGTIFSLLPLNLIFMAVSLFNFENLLNYDLVKILLILICMICSLFWPYFYCYYATWTIYRVSSVGHLVHASQWFDLPVKLQKYIILIIARSQETLHFTGFGLIYCTLEVLGKLWKTSLSYYMLFRTISRR